MVETVGINWLLLVSPFLWSLGIAVLLSLVSVMEFLNARKKISRKDFLKGLLCRRAAGAAVILILVGLLLNVIRIPSDRFITVHLSGQASTSLNTVSPGTVMPFSPGQLKLDPKNKSHYLNNKGMKDSTVAMFWDGYIQTPFMEFNEGNFQVMFEAKGSKVEDEYSRIKVEFDVPGADNYLETKEVLYFELTDKMETYLMRFTVSERTVGRIRITYFNDVYIPDIKRGRDVWIRNVVIK